jgi:hypothetical protein
LYARIAPALTVYSRSNTIDMTVAPPVVAAALATGPSDANATPGADNNAVAHPGTVADVDGLAGHSFAISIAAQHGRTRLARDVVVEFTNDNFHPLLVEAWR